jgi:uncharacterized membrane protein YhiD involved in acid resistance
MAAFFRGVGPLLLAAALGAVVGMEREWRNRPAGLRTHILICLATAAIAILTIEITHVDVFAGQEIRIDPIRLVEATTAGVAFLAAGLIFSPRARSTASPPAPACGWPAPSAWRSGSASGRSPCSRPCWL